MAGRVVPPKTLFSAAGNKRWPRVRSSALMRDEMRIGAIGAMLFATILSLLNLRLRDGRRQLASYDGIRKVYLSVGAVAEGLVGRGAAAPQADSGTTGEAEWRAGGIDDLEVAFHANRTVGVHCDLRRFH